MPTFLLFLFFILLMIVFPDQPGFVFPASLLWSLCPTCSATGGGGDSLGVERAVRIPPLPEHLGDGPGRRLASEPVRNGRKVACCHAAGFYSQFVLFFLFFQSESRFSLQNKIFPIEHHTVQWQNSIYSLQWTVLSHYASRCVSECTAVVFLI